MKKNTNIKTSNERKTVWEGLGVTITEYSEVRQGWDIPFAKMSIVGLKLEAILDGVFGENTMKTPVVKRPFPRKIPGDFGDLSLEIAGELFDPDGHHIGDVYEGVEGGIFMTAVMDEECEPLLYYVMKFDEKRTPEIYTDYNYETGDFKLTIPNIYPDLELNIPELCGNKNLHDALK